MSAYAARHQCRPWAATVYTHAAFAKQPLVGFRRRDDRNFEVRRCDCGEEIEIALGPANDTGASP